MSQSRLSQGRIEREQVSMPGGPGAFGSLKRLWRETGFLPVLFLGMVVLFGSLEGRFLAIPNLENIARQSVYLLLVTLGQMVVLIAGHFDLSVGNTLALTSVITALVMRSGVGGSEPTTIAAGIAAGLAVGLAVGLVNGSVIAFFRVPAFMVTLGTSALAHGTALLLSKGAPITGVPTAFTSSFGTGRLFGVPGTVIVSAVVAGAVYVLLYWTVLGRNMFAVGGNSDAARLAGIRVRFTVVAAFVVCGLLTALSGILLTARVATGEANLGGSYVLLSIAAAVLGGTSLYGGEGRIGLVVLSVLFIGVLTNGMNLVRIPSYVQEVALGIVLIGSVVTDVLRESYRRT